MNKKLDKFYTNPDIVELCINTVNKHYKISEFDLIIEPSIGSGNFYKNLPKEKTIGIDIEPEYENVIKQDFLEFYIDKNKYDNVLVIGNPPFGKNSSTAVKFFNHASKFANIIAMIIPRTFRKISIQNRLNFNFHLINDIDIPTNPCSFTPKMAVKCCFQIWTKNSNPRMFIKLKTEHKDWDFLKLGEKDKNNQPTPPKNADFVIRAYGGKCGEIKTKNLELLRPKSWHWIKSNIEISVLISKFNKINYSNSENTARQNSIGKAELIELYENIL